MGGFTTSTVPGAVIRVADHKDGRFKALGGYHAVRANTDRPDEKPPRPMSPAKQKY
jgi:hypothetical protein